MNTDNEQIVQGIAYYPQGLDPVSHYGDLETRISSQIFEPLVRLDSDYKTIHPRLATTWTYSESEKKYTFELRSDVLFHNGKKFTAHDVVYSYNLQKNKQTLLTFFKMIDSVKAVGEYKINFYLKDNFPVFLQALSSYFGLLILPQGHSSTSLAGTGPFKLKAMVDGEQIILTKFDDYWGKKSLIKQIQFRYFKNRYKIEDAIINNNIDVIYEIPGYSIDRLKWLGKIEYFVQAPRNVIFLGFNNRITPFRDKRLRQAVLKAINIPPLVLNVNRGNAIIARGPLPAAFFQYNSLTQDGFNVKESVKLLKQAGYKDGLTANLIFPSMAFTRSSLVNIIQSDLDKVNIRLNIIKTKTWEEHNRLVKSDSCQLFISGGFPEIVGDMEGMLRDFFYSKSPFNLLGYENNRVDKWLDKAKIEMDPDKRNKFLSLAVEQILKDTPAVFLYHVKPHFAFNREKIKKLVVDPYGIIQYHRLELK